MAVLKVPPFTELATPMEIIKSFGGKKQYLAALKELKNELYRVA
jgi:type I restriction enzyme R subunit